MSLHQSSSLFNYLTQKTLVWFILLCALQEADLILSLGTLTLNNIDHVSIMKSIVYPTPRIGCIADQSEQKHASVYKELNPARSLCWLYRFKD